MAGGCPLGYGEKAKPRRRAQPSRGAAPPVPPRTYAPPRYQGVWGTLRLHARALATLARPGWSFLWVRAFAAVVLATIAVMAVHGALLRRQPRGARVVALFPAREAEPGGLLARPQPAARGGGGGGGAVEAWVGAWDGARRTRIAYEPDEALGVLRVEVSEQEGAEAPRTVAAAELRLGGAVEGVLATGGDGDAWGGGDGDWALAARAGSGVRLSGRIGGFEWSVAAGGGRCGGGGGGGGGGGVAVPSRSARGPPGAGAFESLAYAALARGWQGRATELLACGTNATGTVAGPALVLRPGGGGGGWVAYAAGPALVFGDDAGPGDWTRAPFVAHLGDGGGPAGQAAYARRGGGHETLVYTRHSGTDGRLLDLAATAGPGTELLAAARWEGGQSVSVSCGAAAGCDTAVVASRWRL